LLIDLSTLLFIGFTNTTHNNFVIVNASNSAMANFQQAAAAAMQYAAQAMQSKGVALDDTTPAISKP
jgi:hypothetical protein